VLCGEAINTNFLVIGLTRPELEHTIYRTQGEHANHYTTDAVQFYSTKLFIVLKLLLDNIYLDLSIWVKPMTKKLVFIASPQSTQH
jgi:hypothetical protein